MIVGLVVGYNLKKSSTRDFLIIRDTLEKFYYSHHETLRVYENQKTLIKNNYEKHTDYFHSLPDSLALDYIFNRSLSLLSDTSSAFSPVDSAGHAQDVK
jgi:hypothetical protein